MENSIFKIITASGTGTGFLAQSSEFIITNYHVVQGNKEVALQTTNKDRHLASVLMVNPEVDIALLRCENLQASPSKIQITESITIKNTDKVYIHGFPFGLPYTITEGIVSSAKQMIGQRHYLQTDAAINPGNSGGPILNTEGELVGVTTSKISNADNVGFGVCVEDLIHELASFKDKNETFHVKCNSCEQYLIEKTEYCGSCGNTIDKKVFEEFELSDFAKFIEEAISELNLNPILARAGRDQWEFYQGSALIRIFVFRDEYLFATSPINKLPKQNLQGLYEYLLSNPSPPYFFGIGENQIYISYRVHISDIFSKHKESIKKNITNLAKKADDYDNYFVDEFNCELSIEGNEKQFIS